MDSILSSRLDTNMLRSKGFVCTLRAKDYDIRILRLMVPLPLRPEQDVR
jgi:hypothetical protein